MTHPTLTQTPRPYFQYMMDLANKEDWSRWARVTPPSPLLKVKRTKVKQGSVMRLFIRGIINLRP